MRKLFLLNLIGCLVLGKTVSAQLTTADSLAFKSAYAKSLEVYHQALYPSSTLYNGVRYSGYPFAFKEGHPYFISPETYLGSIERDGVLYRDVRFIFDIVREKIILFNPGGDAILIDNDRVTRFSLHRLNFIRISGDSNSVKPGYYALLYDGHTRVLYKPVKVIRSVIDQGSEQRFIDERNHYYLGKANRYYAVSKKRDVLKVLRDKKSELQQLIRKEQLGFGKQEIAASLVRIAAYYDTLVK